MPTADRAPAAAWLRLHVARLCSSPEQKGETHSLPRLPVPSPAPSAQQSPSEEFPASKQGRNDRETQPGKQKGELQSRAETLRLLGA